LISGTKKRSKVGDTVTDAKPTTNMVKGFEVKPMVLLEYTLLTQRIMKI
jgi:translation elongation factor EF-4